MLSYEVVELFDCFIISREFDSAVAPVWHKYNSFLQLYQAAFIGIIPKCLAYLGVTVVCPFWIKDTEFVDKARETDKQQVYKDMPGAANAKSVAEKSLRAAKAGVVVCTPDTVSTVHRIIASVLPHWLLAKVCKKC